MIIQHFNSNIAKDDIENEETAQPHNIDYWEYRDGPTQLKGNPN